MIDCILWGNEAAEGSQIALYSPSTHIDIAYCDVIGANNLTVATSSDGGFNDDKTKATSHPFYLPAAPAGAKTISLHNKGKWLDVQGISGRRQGNVIYLPRRGNISFLDEEYENFDRYDLG